MLNRKGSRRRPSLPPRADWVRVQRALDKAEGACRVSASLDTPVPPEPEIAG
jgi:hypothetical protein